MVTDYKLVLAYNVGQKYALDIYVCDGLEYRNAIITMGATLCPHGS